MRVGGGLECTVVLAFSAFATWLDSFVGVDRYATFHSTAIVTGPYDGHERAGPEDRS